MDHAKTLGLCFTLGSAQPQGDALLLQEVAPNLSLFLFPPLRTPDL